MEALKLFFVYLMIVFVTGCSKNEATVANHIPKSSNSVKPVLAEVDGTETGGGGDPCENRILVIRDDIKAWILKGEYVALELPSQISPIQYKDYMLKSIDVATVSCTEEKLYYKSIEKTCLFVPEKNGSFKCNFERFSNSSEEEQYTLVHHEYAGLSGLEVNNGQIESDYRISNQISGFLEDFVIKKLVIAPEKSPYSFFKVPNLRSAYDMPPVVDYDDIEYEEELLMELFPGLNLSLQLEEYIHNDISFVNDWSLITLAYEKLTKATQVKIMKVKDNVYIRLLETHYEKKHFLLFNQKDKDITYRDSNGELVSLRKGYYTWYITFDMAPTQKFNETEVATFYMEHPDDSEDHYHCIFSSNFTTEGRCFWEIYVE